MDVNVPIKGGMLVESVVRLSPADFAGVKGGFQKIRINGTDLILGGDIILSVNGLQLTEQAFENLSNNSLNDQDFFNSASYKIEVLRGGSIEELEINFRD